MYYSNYDVTQYSDSIYLQLDDPCIYTVLPSNQNFFPSPQYSLAAFDPAIKFNLSASYLPDNATLWSNVSYFCGYPQYKL